MARNSNYAPLAQQVEHFLGKEEVMGSNPVGCFGAALPFEKSRGERVALKKRGCPCILTKMGVPIHSKEWRNSGDGIT